MATIKCTRCENMVLDTEIVCPYCDYPIDASKEDIKKEQSLKLDETQKISPITEVKKETAIKDFVSEPKEDLVDTMTSSDTTKISLDEYKKVTSAKEVDSRYKKEDKDVKKEVIKWTKRIVTIIGIVIVIYLINSIIDNLLGGKIFEGEKENKKNKEYSASSSLDENENKFKFSNHTLTITDESIVMTDYEPNDKKPWNEHLKDTTNLTIGNDIETIGDYTFNDLRNLKHVTMPDSVSIIGKYAFYGCNKLEKVAINDTSSLKSIDDYAFSGCKKLTSINLGEKITKIGDEAFKSCQSLEEITIPSSIVLIGENAFEFCPKLTIKCEKSSVAYEYAMQNGIKVDVIGEEDEEVEEEENETTSSQAPENDNPPSDAPSPKPDNSQKIAELEKQFADPNKTMEEKQAILKQIAELSK